MCTDERICFASCRHELKRRADFFFSLSFIFFAGGERKLALYVTRENNLVYLGFWSHEALEVKRARLRPDSRVITRKARRRGSLRRPWRRLGELGRLRDVGGHERVCERVKQAPLAGERKSLKRTR